MWLAVTSSALKRSESIVDETEGRKSPITYMDSSVLDPASKVSDVGCIAVLTPCLSSVNVRLEPVYVVLVR